MNFFREPFLGETTLSLCRASDKIKPLCNLLGPLCLGLTRILAPPADRISSLNEYESPPLTWAPCDLDLPSNAREKLTAGDCATLEVPLDYANPDSDRTVQLQLIRYNATKEPFKGSVLWNPGGPGISGVETLALLGPDFREWVCLAHSQGAMLTRGLKHSRGTGRTIPFTCGTNSTSDQHIRQSQDGLPQADLWQYVMNEGWNSMQHVAETCYKTQQEYGRYLSTAFTARDLMRIVDALGEDGKLRYWGISYGTILGQVVASMFPDRISRVLLDSNSLADAYFTSAGIGGPRDAEKSLVHSFSECVELGTETCRLANYSGKGTTVQDLTDAVNSLFQKLTVMTDLPDGLSRIEFPYAGNSILKQLKYAILNYLSSPSTYPYVVEILSYALEGDYKKALSFYREEKSEWNLGTNAMQGIACSESSFRVETPEELYSLYQAHLAESSFGDAIAADYVACGAWKFEAAEGVDTNKLRNVNTSFPILVINSAYDPVTSLSHAWQVSSRFRGSRMLVHEGVGHGVTSHPSNCTLDAIAAYFEDGVLPKVGTRCKPNMRAFEYSNMPNQAQ
ncbi:hypothetical protein FSARC_3625 [Fusarium sarcochroum]|uniref:Peptidase S33 tripeptidyl aminopeptidase-like C-terminal domain-containing protein n=1 Tax=Fusarium sarcochroum TaxID=1208366 RepID=A0A8H4XBI8_9HYPO|nr:hypothetical protein FSARC_3625 [Fusarium sarcochroum]